MRYSESTAKDLGCEYGYADSQSVCLNSYYKTVFDPRVCPLLKERYSEQEDCYTFMAEKKSGTELCEHISNQNKKISCIAFATLDPAWCGKLRSEISGVNDDVGGHCVREVAQKKKDYNACLAINDIEYSEEFSWPTREYDTIAYTEDVANFFKVCGHAPR